MKGTLQVTTKDNLQIKFHASVHVTVLKCMETISLLYGNTTKIWRKLTTSLQVSWPTQNKHQNVPMWSKKQLPYKLSKSCNLFDPDFFNQSKINTKHSKWNQRSAWRHKLQICVLHFKQDADIVKLEPSSDPANPLYDNYIQRGTGIITSLTKDI